MNLPFLTRCLRPGASDRFTSEVLKNYLRTTNFASFVRQLNYYGTVPCLFFAARGFVLCNPMLVPATCGPGGAVVSGRNAAVATWRR